MKRFIFLLLFLSLTFLNSFSSLYLDYFRLGTFRNIVSSRMKAVYSLPKNSCAVSFQ
jgi:hypothetical protein